VSFGRFEKWIFQPWFYPAKLFPNYQMHVYKKIKMGSIHLSSLVYQKDMAKYMKNTIMATKYAKVKKLTGANYLHSFHLEEAQHPNCLFHRKNQALTRGRKQNLTMQLKM
jgi:hypothetical protein